MSPIDDVESLGYLLVYLLGGGPRALPWSGAASAGRGLDDINRHKVRRDGGHGS